LAHAPEPGALVDPTGRALTRLGAERAAAHYLVRADGHVAYRNSGTDVAGVMRYLDRWLRAEVAQGFANS
jgi:hypothetical protein